ncbi:MAG: hypothetical protein V9G10_03600 [Candidatus Nanopelagicales bacterium]
MSVPPTCAELFDWVLSLDRQNDTSGALDAGVDLLGDECPAKYRVWVDYHSIKVETSVTGRGADNRCAGYRDFPVAPAAVKLARSDGYCSGPVSRPDAVAAPRSSGLPDTAWSCTYQPTYNRDWHDDVLCSNGIEQQRPYLREQDGFITEDEMRRSARAYEHYLNGG